MTTDNNLNRNFFWKITGRASKIRILTADLAAGAINLAADSIFVFWGAARDNWKKPITEWITISAAVQPGYYESVWGLTWRLTDDRRTLRNLRDYVTKTETAHITKLCQNLYRIITEHVSFTNTECVLPINEEMTTKNGRFGTYIFDRRSTDNLRSHKKILTLSPTLFSGERIFSLLTRRWIVFFSLFHDFNLFTIFPHLPKNTEKEETGLWNVQFPSVKMKQTINSAFLLVYHRQVCAVQPT